MWLARATCPRARQTRQRLDVDSNGDAMGSVDNNMNMKGLVAGEMDTAAQSLLLPTIYGSSALSATNDHAAMEDVPPAPLAADVLELEFPKNECG